MYIQDEKQRIVGNLDVEGEWGEVYDPSQMGTLVAILPRIGAFVTYDGKSYVITRTVTYQEDSGESTSFLPKPTFTTICRILPISDEGDETGEEPIEVEADKLTLI